MEKSNADQAPLTFGAIVRPPLDVLQETLPVLRAEGNRAAKFAGMG